MKKPTDILYTLASQIHIPDVAMKAINMLVLCASEYATRSPERNKDNPFIICPKLIKSLLDSNSLLFERLYYILGNPKQLETIFKSSRDWYEQASVLPELNHYFPYSELDCSGVTILPNPIKYAHNLSDEYERALYENDLYCQRNPYTSYQVDNEQGRIWVKTFENEGRRRSYWLNTQKAPELLYQLMNEPKLKAMVEQYANARAHCESILCEEVSSPLLFHHGRNWHLDKLADQIKVMLPLESIDEESGPLLWLPNTVPDTLIEQQQPRQHLHHCFIYSGMKTTVANFLPDLLTKDIKEQSALINKDQLILLNTRCIHSGSLASSSRIRKTVTLTFKINSLRNNALNSLPCFY